MIESSNQSIESRACGLTQLTYNTNQRTGGPCQACPGQEGGARPQEGELYYTHISNVPNYTSPAYPTSSFPLNPQAAPAPKPAAAPKKAPVKNPDFAGGLVGSDVEAIAFDPWKLSAERDPEGLAWYRASELKHGASCNCRGYFESL